MPPLSSNATQLNQTQQSGAPRANMKGRSSKPIINWLQRKLGGSVRTRRASEGSANASAAGRGGSAGANASKTVTLPQKGKHSVRITDENTYATTRGRPEPYRSLSNEISLNSIGTHSDEDLQSTRRSSGNAGSLWSRSNQLEADEDASIRPLPPTSPPSPSPSRSSSSYLSNPQTFKSMSISTKPTTILSIDVGSDGMAHIAQAPPTPTSVHNMYGNGGNSRLPHTRTPSTGPATSITFSALPPSPQSSSRPPSLNPTPIRNNALQAPQHTTHHPRNNPRPSSPPLDNASVLTLASSAFGIAPPFNPGHRSSYAFARGADDSASHLGLGVGADSVSILRSGVDDSMLGMDDREASVRALRPRSSRRGSWESEASRWSAGVSSMMGNLAGGRSVRTAPSFRTGGQNTMDDLEDGDGVSMSVADEEDISISREEDMTIEDGDDGLSSRLGDRALSPTSSLGMEAVREEVHPLELLEKTDEEQDSEIISVQGSDINGDIPKVGLQVDSSQDDLKTPAVKPIELITEPETTPKKERKDGVLDGAEALKAGVHEDE